LVQKLNRLLTTGTRSFGINPRPINSNVVRTRRTEPDEWGSTAFNGDVAFCVGVDRVVPSQCDEHWAAAEPLLQRTASGFSQSSSGMGFTHRHAREGSAR
jgi:hypothetical protein